MLDASAAISWFFEDERNADSIAMANAVAEHGAVIPPLFRWEVQNAFAVAVRRKRMTWDSVAADLESLDELGLQVDRAIAASSLTAELGLIQRFELSAYDAAYLELAVRRSLPIMTFDGKLARAASDLRLLWKS